MKQDRAQRGWPQVLLALSVVLLALLAASFALADVAVPPLKARVTDLTGTLTSDQRAALEAKLATFETRKGSQIAVLIVPTTQPETVEQYAVRVEETWKLGRKGIDDGVLLVVAKNDRKLRIEVGYGLEGVLPDATAKRIIEEEIVPRFKQGDFYGGINAGVDRLSKLIDGKAMPPPARTGSSGFDQYSGWLPIGLIVLMMTMGLLRKLLGRVLGGVVAGMGAGIIIYMLSGIVFIALFFGVFFFVFTMFAKDSHTGGMSSGGSWSSGGSSWSSSDSGGFSGGGGSSGGGGASGSW